MSKPASQQEILRRYRVWDRSTRLFHWVNLLCVLVLATLGLVILNAKFLGIEGDAKIWLKTWHVYAGYVFFCNLAWRFVWGFIGNRYARWRAILPGGEGYGGKLSLYIRGFLHPSTSLYLGHNPLARLMVTALFTLLLIQGLTGLILAGTDLYKPPFGSVIAEWVTGGDPKRLAALRPGSKKAVDKQAYETMRDYRKPVVTIHEYNFYLLMAMGVLHIIGVVVTEIRDKNGLVSAMITGEKVSQTPPLDPP